MSCFILDILEWPDQSNEMSVSLLSEYFVMKTAFKMYFQHC